MPGKDGSQPLEMATVIKCSPDVFYSEVAQEAVLLNVQTGSYHSLDEIGSTIWRALATPQSVGEICAKMVEEYPANPDEVRADTLEFVGQLAERNLLIIG
jgi:hypothetical protein